MYWFSSNYLKWLDNNHLISVMVSKRQEFWYYNAWGLRWKTWNGAWNHLKGHSTQASAKCWGLAEAVAGAIRGIPRLASTCGVSLITKNGGWVKLLPLWQRPVAAASMVRDPHGDGPPLPSVTGEGMGERVTAASRPRRSQSRHCFQWAAVAGLEFCETCPGSVPGPLSSPAGKVRFWKALGRRRDPLPTTLSEGHCQADWTRTLPR